MKHYQLILSALVMMSCSAKEEFSVQQDPQARAKVVLSEDEARAFRAMQPKQTVSYDRAIEYARSATAMFEGQTTRSFVRTIGKVSVVTNNRAGVFTRSGAQVVDTSLYVIEYAGDNGYVVVSGEVASEGVLAAAPQGRLNLNDTLTNPAMEITFGLIRQYQERMRAEAAQLKDSLAGQIAERMRAAAYPSGATTRGPVPHLHSSDEPCWPFGEGPKPCATSAEIIIAPIVPVSWEQAAPYNMYVPVAGAPTGCVATAIAQIMAAYKRPALYGGYNFNWAGMTSNAKASNIALVYQQQIAKLMIYLGDWDNLQMDYDISGSGANLETRARPTLDHFGYSTGVFQKYSYPIADASVKQGKPLLIQGRRVDINGKDKWHAWVIDGTCNIVTYYTQQQMMYQDGCTTTVAVPPSRKPGLHSNFGHESECNIYLLAGVFTMKTDSEYKDYKYNLSIIPFICPR